MSENSELVDKLNRAAKFLEDEYFLAGSADLMREAASVLSRTPILSIPVVWRYRWPDNRGGMCGWSYTDDEAEAGALAADDGECEPLYALASRGKTNDHP